MVYPLSSSFDDCKRLFKAILDVKNTSWHEEFSKFRTAVKELEVMVQNLIQSAFETVRSVDDGVLLLDIFGHFSARESIKRYLNKYFLKFEKTYRFQNYRQENRWRLLRFWRRAQRCKKRTFIKAAKFALRSTATSWPSFLGKTFTKAYRSIVRNFERIAWKIFINVSWNTILKF